MSAATFTMDSDLGTTAPRVCYGGCVGAQPKMKANDRRWVAGAEAAARMHLDHWTYGISLVNENLGSLVEYVAASSLGVERLEILEKID
uniref:Uncharacterized protein n=1 Tax=Oryza meridionalis TaxID=40149 RepID=A0A0E0DZU4_9ORYZ